MQLKNIKNIVQDDLNAIDDLINTSLQSKIGFINEISSYITKGNGKRLRPLVILLSTKACGYNNQAHIALATAIEFIHTATLLHDDVIDASTLRRGNATANYKWGNQAAVLVGDFLYSRAFQLLLTANNLSILSTIANATNIIAEGEILQLINRNNYKISEKKYLEIITSKTAKLFESAAELGAILANSSMNTQQALAQYGLQLGITYQIIDDILDYQDPNGKLGKNIGTDLTTGNLTLPLIYLMEHGSEQEKDLIKNTIQYGQKDNLLAIQMAIENSNAFNYSINIAKQHANKAKQAVQQLPQSIYSNAMIELIDFILSRIN